MEKNEGNKLIAEFMGGKFQPELIAPWKFEIPPTPYLREDARIKDLKYNSDWNWLMPVVEKIKSCGYDDTGFELLKKIDHWLVMVQINELWLACIHFINWYNSNPTRTGQKLKDDGL